MYMYREDVFQLRTQLKVYSCNIMLRFHTEESLKRSPFRSSFYSGRTSFGGAASGQKPRVKRPRTESSPPVVNFAPKILSLSLSLTLVVVSVWHYSASRGLGTKVSFSQPQIFNILLEEAAIYCGLPLTLSPPHLPLLPPSPLLF